MLHFVLQSPSSCSSLPNICKCQSLLNCLLTSPCSLYTSLGAILAHPSLLTQHILLSACCTAAPGGFSSSLPSPLSFLRWIPSPSAYLHVNLLPFLKSSVRKVCGMSMYRTLKWLKMLTSLSIGNWDIIFH